METTAARGEATGFDGLRSDEPTRPTPLIDAVVARLATAARERLTETRARARRVHESVERYVAMVEHNIASDLARKNSLEVETASLASDARDIRGLVDRLLGEQLEPHSVPDVDAPPPGAVATLSADIDAAELQSIQERPLLRSHVQEFAARARILQDAGVAPSEVWQLGTIFRRLTKLCCERHISGVIGLRRDHRGDWNALAKSAVAGRNSPPTPQPLTHRIEIPAGLRDAIVEGSEDGVEMGHRPSLALLAAASREAPVQIVGGQARPERLLFLTRTTGVQVEWVALDDHEERALESLVGRIERGCTAGVILLNGLMGHRGYTRIIEVARRADLPTAYAERGGGGRIERALEQLEAILRQRDGEGAMRRTAE